MGDANTSKDASVRVEEASAVWDPIVEDGDLGSSDQASAVRLRYGSTALKLVKSKTRSGSGTMRVFFYEGEMRAAQVLRFASKFACEYGDELTNELWVDVDERSRCARKMARGARSFALVCPFERSADAEAAIGVAKAAWLDLHRTRASVRFEFGKRHVIVEEFGRAYPDCGNGSPCEWLYFEGADGSLYENNRTYNTWAHIWPDGTLTRLTWADGDERLDFVGALKPVEDPQRIAEAVSFSGDRGVYVAGGWEPAPRGAAGLHGKVRAILGL